MRVKNGYGRASAAVFGFIIFLFCFLPEKIALGGDAQSGTAPLTLKDFCSKVLANYPRLKEQGATVELAIARKLQAQAGFWPRLQGQAGAAYSDDPVYVFGSLLRQRAFTQEDFDLDRLNRPNALANFNLGLHGEIPLFNAFQTISSVRQANHMLASAKHDEEFARMEAILVACDAYLNAVAVEKVLAKVAEACTHSETDIKQAHELKEKGVVLGADFYTARVIFGGLRNSLNSLKAQQQSMHALLNILMGDDPLKPVQLGDDLKETGRTEIDLKQWLAQGRTQRPDLLSIEEAIHAQEANLYGARASAWPVVSAFGDISGYTRDFGTGGGNFAVGLKATVDIFDPGRSPQVTVAEKSLKKMKYAQETATDSMTKDITAEYARLESLRTNLPVLRDMASDSDQAVDLVLPLYREGKKSIADLLDMRQGNVRTYQAYYSTLAGSKNSSLRLLFLAGRLDESQAVAMLGGGQ
jgi:outer membrane protein TolC